MCCQDVPSPSQPRPELPLGFFSSTKRSHQLITKGIVVRNLPTLPDQQACASSRGQTIKRSTAFCNEIFQRIQSPNRFKGLSNEFDAHVCSEAACTAACTLLLSHRVRCRICPQEELRILHCALHEFQPILLCLQDWEAVVVRIDATFKDCIPVVAKVMSCNCGSNIRSSLFHKACHCCCRNVLTNHSQIWTTSQNHWHNFVIKVRFTIEDVHGLIC
mmetsp:Transcript_35274/g.76219  ORF Transcript_35274/g.76219 Transcript_35274/m.76219 type:complete len:217 (-) Transcript_35274:478-1128(-)